MIPPPRLARRTGDIPWGWFALFYAVLIAYGSLYPFKGWRPGSVSPLALLALPWPAHLSVPDALTNLLAYMPLGLFVACALRSRYSLATSIITATIAGSVLSLTVECLQQLLPTRVASLADLVINIAGAAGGATGVAVVRGTAARLTWLHEWRDRWFLPGRRTDAGMLAIALWALSQLTPLVPSLDLGNLRQGVAPLWKFVQHPGSFSIAQWATYTLNLAGLALLARTLKRPGRPVAALFFLFATMVLLYKIPVVTRQLSAEALFGLASAAILALPLSAAGRRANAIASGVLILGGFTVAELATTGTGITYPFNWVPFSAQLENTLIGIASIIESIWPAAALAYLAVLTSSSANRFIRMWAGGIGLAIAAFALEWRQQFLPARVGDITTVVLMVSTWATVWRLIPPYDGSAETAGQHARQRHHRRPRPLVVATVALVGVAIGVAGILGGERVVETRVDESRLPQLPPPNALPPAPLQAFRYEHPRLPSPTASEIARLKTANPDFVRQLRGRAAGGKGELEAAVLQALVDRGSVNLDLLHRRLMGLRFSWRGHAENKPLAVAYDWLYDEWTPTQRAQLRSQLVEGCNYLITIIRTDRLSPYNVIMYNAPLQALMACAIALYGDDPRGEPVMRFTYDLWEHRVLPAWRQVMGTNGGWHEGGEYVGIGIGQAIYELPAMWRKATGEDVFSSEPGIRGFLDFLVYRTRPDGTHFRWGDGSFFDRNVPDAVPLAIEFQHAAAYALSRPNTVQPSAWPWGPLTEPQLLAPAAEPPLTRYFDGIGMLVARSDWSPDATYVTFKAGDNYWSHEHLDEGAFTIYKGGELAIDSGVYVEYGSEHHLNYAYQTVAHNTITVTDPDDTVPAPGKKESRPIANDGGQRRIGSGWGVEPAPLDLAEWQSKREIYHTGTMEKVFDDDGLSVAVADVTPAYTNRLSGDGTFSHRTRRVERFWRLFGYDRVDDVVVVFDQVIATDASFRKRWLFHTLEAPHAVPGGFDVSVSPAHRVGHGGGRLEARVLLPRDAQVTAIGGRGFEFFVDDKNYDDSGALRAAIAKLGPTRGEPGAWRVEITPGKDAVEDRFLVVMLPTLGSVHPEHRVRLLESGTRVGCEIVGTKRTTRWWFTPGTNGVEIEVIDAGIERRHAINGPPAPPIEPRGWVARVRKWLDSLHAGAQPAR